MRELKINDNVTLTINERFDSLISYAEAAYTKTGDKSHLKVIKKLTNSNKVLRLAGIVT